MYSGTQPGDVFLGHGALAFAIAAAGAVRFGRSRERALLLGALAGAFATAPDVDMAYALAGLAVAPSVDALVLAEQFWATGSLVHRAVTHSLVVAPAVALAAALWAYGGETGAVRPGLARPRPVARVAAVAALVALVLVAAVRSGWLGGFVMALFALATLAVATVAGRRSVRPRVVLTAALVGLLTHPFGDLLTGEPPTMLYPLDATLVADRIALHPDPTLHLLGAFGVELLTLWLGLAVALWLLDVVPAPDRGPILAPRATLGVGYAASVLVIPAPTLDLSYPFVYSVLAVGALGLLPRVRLVAGDSEGGHRWTAGRVLAGTVELPDRDGTVPTVELPDWASALVTALATVTVAWLAYALAYLLV